MWVNVSELAARIFLIYFCALVGHSISSSSCFVSVIFTEFTVETNSDSWVWVRLWFCQPWSLWMYLMTQFSAVLEQCAIRNKRDVYSVVMVIVKHRKYLQTCLKISRKVPGSTPWVGCVCLSVSTMEEGRFVLILFGCSGNHCVLDWLQTIKSGAQWDSPTCFMIDFTSSYTPRLIQKELLHRTGLESLPCSFTLLPAWRFSFALVCPLGNIFVPHLPPPQDRRSLLVFCLHRTSEKGTLVHLEEEPSVFPRVWVMILQGHTVAPDRYKNHLQTTQNTQKWLRYSYSFQHTFCFSFFLCWRMLCQVAFLPVNTCLPLNFCGTCTRQNLTLQALTILANVIPLIRYNIVYLPAFHMSLHLWSWKVININKVFYYPSTLQNNLFSPWKCLQNKQCCEIIVGNACVILAPDKCTIEINQLSQH